MEIKAKKEVKGYGKIRLFTYNDNNEKIYTGGTVSFQNIILNQYYEVLRQQHALNNMGNFHIISNYPYRIQVGTGLEDPASNDIELGEYLLSSQDAVAMTSDDESGVFVDNSSNTVTYKLHFMAILSEQEEAYGITEIGLSAGDPEKLLTKALLTDEFGEVFTLNVPAETNMEISYNIERSFKYPSFINFNLLTGLEGSPSTKMFIRLCEVMDGLDPLADVNIQELFIYETLPVNWRTGDVGTPLGQTNFRLNLPIDGSINNDVRISPSTSPRVVNYIGMVSSYAVEPRQRLSMVLELEEPVTIPPDNSLHISMKYGIDLQPVGRRWGIRIAKDVADPDERVTYLYDAEGMTPAYMDFNSGKFNYGGWEGFCREFNRPVMLNPDGSVAYELDPNDQTKKLDGTASSIDSTTHDLNAMSEFKRLWLKTETDPVTGDLIIVFSDTQIDETYHAHAFTNEDGQIRDHMYYAMFEGSNVSSKLRSIAAGSVMANRPATTEITYAEANGAGWHINYKSQRDFITYLLALISKSTNSQAVFGQGNSNSYNYIAPGALKAKGRFWGDDATDAAVKVFFIENFWGNYWKRMSGMLYNDAAKILVKATPPYSLTGVGYTNTDVTPTGASGNYITAGTLTDAGFLPTTVGGSNSTYFADSLWYSTPAAGTFHVALVGGSRVTAGKCGSWACCLTTAGDALTSLGASLSFLKYAV